jgi:hypothetical protein
MAKKFLAGGDDSLQFLHTVGEDPTLNQYWYSARTIRAIIDELESTTTTNNATAKPDDDDDDDADAGARRLRIAFLSTPSLYFSLTPGAGSVQESSIVFDFDTQWSDHPNYRFFDYNDVEGTIGDEMRGTFDMCVIDPPFITKDVWAKYATAARLCLRSPSSSSLLGGGGRGGKVMCTTVAENETMLNTLFGGGIRSVKFMPSIPHLPYQYRLFVNFEPTTSSSLDDWNDEIPREDFEGVLFSSHDNNNDDDDDEEVIDRGVDAFVCTGGKVTFEELLERELEKENASNRDRPNEQMSLAVRYRMMRNAKKMDVD